MARTKARFTDLYRDREGLIVTAFDETTGAVIDDEPLIADFGDVLPFLAHFGMSDFALDQIRRARPHLRQSLWRDRAGRTRLFSNHDWLLGLLELYEMTGEAFLLETATAGAHAVLDGFMLNGLLIDERPSWRRPPSLLCRATPFNIGYIELFLDLYACTGEPRFLDASRSIVAALGRTRFFREQGVFGTLFCSWSPAVDRLAAQASKLRALLFKDNTNAMWSILALHRVDPDPRWQSMIDTWLTGFERHFLNGGDTLLWIGSRQHGDVALKASFPAVDLLCDLHAAGASGRAIDLAETIGRRWLEHQWPNGLFPEHPGRAGNHLDCNTDMTTALMKLAAQTGDLRFRDAAARSALAIMRLHERPNGMVLSVDSEGATCDNRIVVKYQSLALKLALLPADPADLSRDPALMKLLRDR